MNSFHQLLIIKLRSLENLKNVYKIWHTPFVFQEITVVLYLQLVKSCIKAIQGQDLTS